MNGPLAAAAMKGRPRLREATGPLAGCRSCGRSARPWCDAASACHRSRFHPRAPSIQPRTMRASPARRKVRLVVDVAREDVGASIRRSRVQPLLQRGAGLLHDLEQNRPAGLVLDNRRPVSHAASRGDVVDPKANEIAAAQLAIDGEIEQRQIALALLHLKPDTNGPGTPLLAAGDASGRRGGPCSTACVNGRFST